MFLEVWLNCHSARMETGQYVSVLTLQTASQGQTADDSASGHPSRRRAGGLIEVFACDEMEVQPRSTGVPLA
jgi:hypothetical protein